MKIYQYKALLIHFMLNALNNDNKITIILELIKYPVTNSFLSLIHTQIQRVTLTTRESCLSPIIWVKRLSRLVKVTVIKF